ncbi:MAG: YceD family protein [Acidimicrobiales bacterium]|jgi:uncharacterized protein
MTAGPLRVGVADLRRHLGARRALGSRVVLVGLRITTAAVPDEAEIGIDLELESIANGVVAEGRITVPWVGECRRCLQPVEGLTEVAVREIFERDPVEGETYPLGEDEVVDLEPMVRDTALLSLPLAPLCQPDCLGPAPERFPALVEGAELPGGRSERAREVRDPRWAALDQLRFDDADAGDSGVSRSRDERPGR